MAATGSAIRSANRRRRGRRAASRPPGGGHGGERVGEDRPDEGREPVEVDGVGAQPLDHGRVLTVDGMVRAGVAVGEDHAGVRVRRQQVVEHQQVAGVLRATAAGPPCCTAWSSARWNARSAATSGAHAPGR